MLVFAIKAAADAKEKDTHPVILPVDAFAVLEVLLFYPFNVLTQIGEMPTTRGIKRKKYLSSINQTRLHHSKLKKREGIRARNSFHKYLEIKQYHSIVPRRYVSSRVLRYLVPASSKWSSTRVSK